MMIPLFLTTLMMALCPNNVYVQSFSRTTLLTRRRKRSLALFSSQVITVPPFAEKSDDYPNVLHNIHVEDLLTIDQATKCLEFAHNHAKTTGCWDSPDFERHVSYATCDFPLEACSDLQEYLKEIDFDDRLFGRLSDLYGVDKDDMEYLDLFCAHYQAKSSEDDSTVMDRLVAHRDGSLLSFTLLLSPPDSFEGGGTFYDALRDAEPVGALQSGGVLLLDQGQVCYHCGKLLHGASTVTSGSRTVLVGFVEVNERCMRPEALPEACKHFGRMDVAKLRSDYQKTVEAKQPNYAVIKDALIRPSSAIRSVLPHFATTHRRADPEFQRRQKLVAEDKLLRSLLLPPEERPERALTPLEVTGDITIM